MTIRSALPLAPLALALVLTTNASGEELRLAPRYEPGDAYALSLRTTTETRAVSQGGGRDVAQEEVTLTYRASVLVLEVDRHGHPTRERHASVRLTAERPEGSDELFGEGTIYEVRRNEGGGLRLRVHGTRPEPAVETAVADVLATQFEYTAGPALLEPGRPVAAGETWALDPDRARRFLRAHGLRAARLDGPARATLRAADDGDRVIDYRIPVARFRVPGLAPNARPAGSEAHLEGRIRIPADAAAPRLHRSHLALSMHGVFEGDPGVTRTTPWRVERVARSHQATRVVRREELARSAEPELQPQRTAASQILGRR
jgi:hypothetical protein